MHIAEKRLGDIARKNVCSELADQCSEKHEHTVAALTGTVMGLLLVLVCPYFGKM